MCMEDIRVMRRTLSRSYTVAIPGSGSVRIVQPNRNRVSLIIAVPGGVGVFCMFGEEAPFTTGIRLIQSLPPLMLNIHDNGTLVTGPWSASSAATATTVVVHETILEEQ